MADDIVQELHDWAYIVDESQGKATLVMLSGQVFTDAAVEIERLRATIADRDQWNDRLVGDVYSILMAIPRPLRKWAYLRSQQIRKSLNDYGYHEI